MTNVRAAFTQGSHAAHSGEDRNSNPHPRTDSAGTPFSAWDDGWNSVQCQRWQDRNDWDRANA